MHSRGPNLVEAVAKEMAVVKVQDVELTEEATWKWIPQPIIR